MVNTPPAKVDNMSIYGSTQNMLILGDISLTVCIY